MRIDMVSEHASPLAVLGGVDAGGQNVHVAALATALASRGAQVRVFTRRDDPALAPTVELVPGVQVCHVDAGPPAFVPKDDLWPFMDEFARCLADQWSVDPPDVAHAHFWMSGYATLTAARRTGVPVALTYHALGVVKKRQQGVKDTSPAARLRVEARLAREVDRVIATSTEEAMELVRQGANPRRVNVVPCGVELERFFPARFGRPPQRDHLEVAIVSRLVERKGIGNVIEAVADVPSAHLVVAGGPSPDQLDRDSTVAHYRALAEQLGVSDRVRLIGAVPRHDVPHLMRGADVVACCPWYEPFGMVAVEAMACGIPVVASAVGGLAETVVDGHTGLHVPPRAPAAISEALRALSADPAKREAMGAAAARRSRRYGWERVAQATEASLASIATRHVRLAEARSLA